jgi:hypothetical protein
VSYEDLVHDLEGQAHRLIDFLNLEWNPACLAFHRTRRVVRTASLTQVHQPIHPRSIGRWQRYETLYTSLFQALERHGIGVPSPPMPRPRGTSMMDLSEMRVLARS